MPICKKNSVDYKEVQVANDGISIATNPDLKVDCMTTEQLKELWEQGSKVKALSEIDPKFPDTELSLFGPGTDSGTFEFFTEEINGEEGNTRKDYQPSEDDNVLVQGVEGEQGGLGYFGFSYYEQNQDNLGLVRVDSGDGCVEPSKETIANGELHAALAPAVHVSEREGPQAARGQGVHGLRRPELSGDLGGVADRPDVRAAGRRGPDRPRRQRDLRMEAGSSSVANGKRGGTHPPRFPAPLGRGHHQGAADAGGPDLGPHDDRHRVVADRGDDQLLR